MSKGSRREGSESIAMVLCGRDLPAGIWRLRRANAKVLMPTAQGSIALGRLDRVINSQAAVEGSTVQEARGHY